MHFVEKILSFADNSEALLRSRSVTKYLSLQANGY